MGRENTYTKVAAVCFVPQVRLQAVRADNSHVFFPHGDDCMVTGFFYITSGESISPFGAVVASWCCQGQAPF